MVFVSRRSVFDRVLAGSTVLAGKRPEKQPKPRVRRVKPPSAPQPGKNAPLLDKRVPGETPQGRSGQKNDLEEVMPG
jgi:hypothetical protein